MFRRIYAIYDRVASEVFGPVMVLPNDAVAIRTFRDALFQPDSRNHADYDLYCLGYLDTETGALNHVLGNHELGSPIFGAVPPVVTGAALAATSETRNGEANNAAS